MLYLESHIITLIDAIPYIITLIDAISIRRYGREADEYKKHLYEENREQVFCVLAGAQKYNRQVINSCS